MPNNINHADLLYFNGINGGTGDYGTPEQTIPGRAPKHAWETCMTVVSFVDHRLSALHTQDARSQGPALQYGKI